MAEAGDRPADRPRPAFAPPAPDGSIYIGTSLNNQGRPGEKGQDVLARHTKDFPGGHIYRFEPDKELQSRKRMQRPDPGRPISIFCFPGSEDHGGRPRMTFDKIKMLTMIIPKNVSKSKQALAGRFV